MLSSQKIHYEIGGRGEATPFGGLFAMHRLVTRLGWSMRSTSGCVC
jgi:hypothetical protein